MKSTVSPRAAAILNFIAMYESRGNYLAYFGHGTSMKPLPATLGAVLQFQADLVEKQHAKSSACGRYQFMPKTLQSLASKYRLPLTTPFTNDFQDVLGCALLEARGYSRWTAGTLSTDGFADELSEEWASLPYNTGKSYYDGDGLNHSLVARDTFVAALTAAAGLADTVAPSVVADASVTAVAASISSRIGGLATIITAPVVEALGVAVPKMPDIGAPVAPAPNTPPIPASPSPAPVASAPQATDPLQGLTDMFTTAATAIGLIKNVMAGASLVAQYAPLVPTIVGTAESKLVPDGEKLFADGKQLIEDVKSGKYGDAASVDLPKIVADVEQAVTDAGMTFDSIASAVNKSPTLPSVAGLKTAAAA